MQSNASSELTPNALPPPQQQPQGLFPPLNFNQVEEGIYRSGIPFELNFEFLKTLKLRTVVILSSNYVDDSLSHFFEENHVHVIYGENMTGIAEKGYLMGKGGVHHIGGHHHGRRYNMRGVLPFAEETVTETLKVLSDKANYPVLVICKTGKNLTGVVVACLRKLQRWTLISIYEEFRRYAGGSRLQQQHEQFIELFDTDLVPIREGISPEFLTR
mmetsp:Transcript_8521/g.14138  ORF Transcript_8521/g.14138 Transcript_8521/m.14138 type:complete len:215 (+) Transcript_8521:56-700(+)